MASNLKLDNLELAGIKDIVEERFYPFMEQLFGMVGVTG